MKIYTVIVSSVYDYEDTLVAIPYTDKDEAIDRYMIEVNAAQRDAENGQWDIEEDYTNHDREDTEKSYCIYDNGAYTVNHILVRLQIDEVNNAPYMRCKKELCHQCHLKSRFTSDWCKECEFYEES